MKKLFVCALVAGSALALCSCKSSKEEAPLSILNGEWNIVEVDNSAIALDASKESPFIGFDTQTQTTMKSLDLD